VRNAGAINPGGEVTIDLLDFARGPALLLSAAVFLLGVAWRLWGLWRLPSQADRSPPREGAPGPLTGAGRAIVRGLWPRREFGDNALVITVNGYVLHIGLALVVLAYAPHIDFIHRHLGLGWPALPDAVMYLSAAAVIYALLFALWSRLDDPVRRRLSSGDDYLTWVVTFLPFVTGMAVASEPSAQILARDAVLYRLPLAVHLLSLELLLVWFPFGKLMHAVLFPLSRAATGRRFSRRGVRA